MSISVNFHKREIPCYMMISGRAADSTSSAGVLVDFFRMLSFLAFDNLLVLGNKNFYLLTVCKVMEFPLKQRRLTFSLAKRTF